nr:GDSL-type esterase/lipase family protein [Blautia sp. MSK.20.85]
MFEKGTAKTHWQAYFNSYKSSENQVLFDKVIDTLGDSITEQRTWQGYVADALHTGVIYNHGIGGTRISGNDSNAMWQDSRINALNDDIDCLLIMGGTNDGAQGVTIGDMSRDNVNTDTFVGAYNVLLSKVFYKYYRLGSGYSGITQTSEVNPIQIMIATPIYCNDSNYGNMDEIAEAVRGVANLWSIPVADQHAKSGINSATSSIYLSDNVHPNDEGGKKVANVWVNALKSNAELIN